MGVSVIQDSSSHDLPLPERLRPKALDELIGQDTIWSRSSPLRRLVEKDAFYNLIFWGPPGTGKTSLATVIGHASSREILALSAVHATVKDLRHALETSEERLREGKKALILFVDEIHRLSKNQQDVLLPGLERGLVRFIGATTENPSFSVNNAILSRSLVFQFKPLSTPALITLLKDALARAENPERQTPELQGVTVTEDALLALASSADGDARRALNLLNAAASLDLNITQETIAALSVSMPLRYDRDGEQHYDTISAFIKSIRASHPDAAVYYLARMIESGEDPLFIARRLLIAASEDVGNANPMALLIAESTFRAVEMLGLPEARIPLSQCTVYLSSSPKSNRAYVAINAALEDVKNTGDLEIPMHLRNAPTKLMKNAGYGKDYAYAHDDLKGARSMSYLPPQMKGRRYYEPLATGAERQLLENLRQLRPTED